jgi:hypothetical protein
VQRKITEQEQIKNFLISGEPLSKQLQNSKMTVTDLGIAVEVTGTIDRRSKKETSKTQKNSVTDKTVLTNKPYSNYIDSNAEPTPLYKHYIHRNSKRLQSYKQYTLFGQKHQIIDPYANNSNDGIIYLTDDCIKNKTPAEVFNHFQNMESNQMTILSFSEDCSNMNSEKPIYRLRIPADSKLEYRKERLCSEQNKALPLTKEEIMNHMEVLDKKGGQWLSLTDKSQEIELTEYSDLVTISL